MRVVVLWSGVLAACGADAACEIPGTQCVVAGLVGEAALGDEDVEATASTLYFPQDVAVGADRWWIDDDNNHRIREVDREGIVRTVAGVAFPGDGPQGPADEARINHPSTLLVDPFDPRRIWVTAIGNHRVSALGLQDGSWRYYLGSGFAGSGGDGGSISAVELDRPSSVAVDDDGAMYVADRLNQVIRRVSADGQVVRFAGQPMVRGYAGDGGPAREATLHTPIGAEFEPTNRLEIHDGVLWVADTGSHVLRTIDLATGRIDTVAGRAAPGFDGDGEDALDTRLYNPYDVAVSADGRVLIADTGNHCVRELVDGVLVTRAGVCGEPGAGAARGDAATSLLDAPSCVTWDGDDAFYVCDTRNHVVRRVVLPRHG